MKKRAKKKNSEKDKEQKIPEKSGLEGETKKEKKEIKNDGFMEELDAQGIISSQELRQIIMSEAKVRQMENAAVSRSLEGGIIFAPRMRDAGNATGKLYEIKYDKPLYDKPEYDKRTPGVYTERGETSSRSSEKSSSPGSDNSSGGSP